MGHSSRSLCELSLKACLAARLLAYLLGPNCQSCRRREPISSVPSVVGRDDEATGRAAKGLSGSHGSISRASRPRGPVQSRGGVERQLGEPLEGLTALALALVSSFVAKPTKEAAQFGGLMRSFGRSTCDACLIQLVQINNKLDRCCCRGRCANSNNLLRCVIVAHS